jgi:hypothetical protein
MVDDRDDLRMKLSSPLKGLCRLLAYPEEESDFGLSEKRSYKRFISALNEITRMSSLSDALYLLYEIIKTPKTEELHGYGLSDGLVEDAIIEGYQMIGREIPQILAEIDMEYAKAQEQMLEKTPLLTEEEKRLPKKKKEILEKQRLSERQREFALNYLEIKTRINI